MTLLSDIALDASTIGAALALLVWAWWCWSFLAARSEQPVHFSWERPAEASPSWTGKVLSEPKIHPPGSPPTEITAYDPATAYELATFPSLTPQDMHDLVSRAESAAKQWSTSSFQQRRRVLKSLLAWCIRDMQAIAEVCCRDTGKTMLDAAFGEVLGTCEKLRWCIAEGEQSLKSDYRSNPWMLAHKVSYVRYEPFGVVGAIVSWNYPFHNLLSPIIAAITSGNCIVMKTSENVAWSSSHFTKGIKACLTACGENPDIVQVAIGCEAEAAAAFTRDGRVSHLTFIGSDAVGKQVARNAAEALTPVTLELGGKDPAILLASADVKTFCQSFLRGSFTGAGQGCIAAERFICDDISYPKFLAVMEPLVKSLQTGRDVGAMINGERLAALEKLVQEAVDQGARILVGGKRAAYPAHPKGHYLQPTLLCDVTQDMRIAHEECFAPIMLAFKAKDIDDCIQIANASKYGLGSSVWGRDKAQCRYVRDRLKCGMVSINDFGTFYLCQALPFGGVKASGYGRFGGPEGLRALCNVKAVIEDRLHGLIQTTIPGPLQFPIRNADKSFRFVYGLIQMFYTTEGITGRLGGIRRMLGAL